MSVPYTPHEYQREAIKFLVSKGQAGLFLDPGLGKTSIIYAAFKLLRQRGYVQNMLIVAPLRPAQTTWPNEAKKWTDFNDLKVVILHGPRKEELLCSDADVFVINPEGLDWLFKSMDGAPGWWDMLVIDESTRFKHTNTQRFKLLKGDKYGRRLARFKYRFILTGSPAPNGLMDLYGQIYILDLGATLGQFISHFRINYFYTPYKDSYVWLPRPGAADAIYERIKPLVIRMAAKDYLNMPPLIEPPPIEIDLSPAVMQKYMQMEAALVAQIEDKVILAANAGVAMNKCKQIAAGGIFHEGGKEWTNLHNAKAEVVADIVEELNGKPALIAYEYQHDLERLRGVFGEDVPYIGGGVSAKRFKEIEEAWNAGSIPVLLAQPQSVAHGLNLQGVGAAVIWHTLPVDLEVYEQFIRRIWRQGQKERVVNHRIVARGTVDEVLIAMIKRKDRSQQALLNALKSHLKMAA
jgi:SNF2 family DNA or RNA helicase